MSVKFWTEKKQKKLAEMYPDLENKELAKLFNVSRSSISNQAQLLSLKKSKKHIEKMKQKTLFQKGNAPFNAGLKASEYLSADAISKMKKTQFKKNQTAHNRKEIGHERITDEGYTLKKTEKGYRLKHQLIWQEANGDIPDGMIIVFKDKNPNNLALSNLEMITRQELMRRNNVGKYPLELQRNIRLINRLNKLSKKLKNGKE